MAFSSGPPPKPCYKSRPTEDTSAPGSAFWRYCIPGDKTFIIIHTSIASFPAGGIARNQRRWISCRRQFLFPVKVLSRVFRGKFIAYLKTAFRDGELGFHGELKCLGENRKFIEWLNRAAGTEWVVYAKPPFGGPRQVLKYLARYTHRVAISNQRLVSLEDGRVTFRWKNYARGSELATMTLNVEEFIRRFLLNVLPKGFVKIRHFGFLANRGRRENVVLCRKLLAASSTVDLTPGSSGDRPRNG
jgi:hypothetical protein